MLNRRSLLALVAAALLLGSVPSPAIADSGHGGGGGGGSGSGSGGGGGDDGGDSGNGGGDDGGGDDNSGSGGGDDDDDDGQRGARDAWRQGQASPLRDVLGSVRRRYKGKVVDVKFSGKRKAPTYRIKLIDDQGRLITVSVDALTKRILRVSGL